VQKWKGGFKSLKSLGETEAHRSHIGVMLVWTLKFNANVLGWSARGNIRLQLGCWSVSDMDTYLSLPLTVKVLVNVVEQVLP
jgi:hypothetical protein